jgi:predicted GIY-YIG superfamily endonuclease
MHPRFAEVAEALHGSFERLMAQEPRDPAQPWQKEKVSGVYLFSEGDRHLYVGRTNDVRARYGRHCLPGAHHGMAAFAFRLAREATGQLKATYRAGAGSRAALAVEPEFKAAFDAAKARVRTMDFRHVEEADPVRQCVLEIYCAVALETPYNNFDNH